MKNLVGINVYGPAGKIPINNDDFGGYIYDNDNRLLVKDKAGNVMWVISSHAYGFIEHVYEERKLEVVK